MGHAIIFCDCFFTNPTKVEHEVTEEYVAFTLTCSSCGNQYFTKVPLNSSHFINLPLFDEDEEEYDT